MLTRRGTHAVVRPSLALAPLAALAVAVAGCHHHQEDSNAKGQKLESSYKLESVSTNQLEVSAPVAVIQGGDKLVISGTVHRRPGVSGVLDGRVDIDLIGPDGLALDKSLHCNLQPSAVPLDPSQNATYAPTPFGYIPPAGSTLRARYVDPKAMILENLRDGDLNYNGNGGHTGADVAPTQQNGSAPANPTGGGSGM